MAQKTVLIIGGSRGIGAAASSLFYENGYQVGITYNKSKEAARALCTAHPGMEAFFCDVESETSVQEAVAQMTATFGKIDVLINNAGIALMKLFTDTTSAEWERMFRVNVTGAYYACKAVLPQMIRRQSGRIINVSSMWGQTGASCEVAYSASKAAVIGFTKALAKEVGLSGITVNCVAPGVIDTDMNAALTEEDRAALCEETPLARIGSAREAAGAMLFLAGEHASFITGQVIAPNGGIVI